MPDFAYVARDLQGKKVSGSLTANSERDAASMLAAQSLFPVTVTKQKQAESFRLTRGVSGQTMANFFFQLASLLRSGVPLLKSIRILRDQTKHPTLKQVLEEIHRRVEDGESIGVAMSRFPKVFNEVSVNMAKAGAEGGFLEDALERVAKFTEQQNDLKARTLGALMYPAILFVAGSTIVSVLIIFFVPKFGELFDQMRKKGGLPWATEALLGFSNLIQSKGIFIAIGLIAAAILLYLQLKTPSGRRMLDLFKLKMPLFGVIFQNLAVARFCRVLGTLLKNGVPILKSLEISREAAGNKILSSAVEQASTNITAGESLATPLQKCGYFPQTVVEMISVAEESNSLDTVLVDVADGLETRTSRNLDLLVRMLEPVMLIIMAGVVMFVVMALLLPIMQMGSMMRK